MHFNIVPDRETVILSTHNVLRIYLLFNAVSNGNVLISCRFAQLCRVRCDLRVDEPLEALDRRGEQKQRGAEDVGDAEEPAHAEVLLHAREGGREQHEPAPLREGVPGASGGSGHTLPFKLFGTA